MAARRYVAVVGPAEAGGEEEQLAEAVGAELARHGAVLLCGGLGGVMAAACRGAAGLGGLTVGILPGTDRTAANPWVQVAIPTGLGELRNGLVVRAADVVVAIGGAGRSHGTLSEIALGLRTGVPVIGLKTWPIAGVRAAGSPERAVALALEAVSSRSPAAELW